MVPKNAREGWDIDDEEKENATGAFISEMIATRDSGRRERDNFLIITASIGDHAATKRESRIHAASNR